MLILNLNCSDLIADLNWEILIPEIDEILSARLLIRDSPSYLCCQTVKNSLLYIDVNYLCGLILMQSQFAIFQFYNCLKKNHLKNKKQSNQTHVMLLETVGFSLILWLDTRRVSFQPLEKSFIQSVTISCCNPTSFQLMRRAVRLLKQNPFKSTVFC